MLVWWQNKKKRVRNPIFFRIKKWSVSVKTECLIARRSVIDRLYGRSATENFHHNQRDFMPAKKKLICSLTYYSVYRLIVNLSFNSIILIIQKCLVTSNEQIFCLLYKIVESWINYWRSTLTDRTYCHQNKSINCLYISQSSPQRVMFSTDNWHVMTISFTLTIYMILLTQKKNIYSK